MNKGDDMLNIAICDDSPDDREKLYNVLKLYAAKNNTEINITAFSGGEELLSNINDRDIVFLDIEMDGINGIETAQRIRSMNITVPIVYVTSYSKYWRSAYKVHAFDFISKPYIEGDIFSVMDDFIASAKAPETIKVQIDTENGTVIVDASQVCYLLIQKKRSVIVGMTDSEIISTETLIQLAEKLDSQAMFQIHRSCYVNLRYVQNYSKTDGVVLQTGIWLPLARQRQDEFLYALSKYLRKG